jgi:hypothetical protein
VASGHSGEASEDDPPVERLDLLLWLFGFSQDLLDVLGEDRNGALEYKPTDLFLQRSRGQRPLVAEEAVTLIKVGWK